MTATISGDGTSTLINLTTSGNTILGDASTDTLNVGNGGLVKDASGNVGIGTSSVTSGVKLQVQSTGGTVLLIKDTTSGSGDYSNIWFGDEALDYSGYLGYNHGTDAMTFGTVATERMRIDSSGNLLVGMSSASTTAKGVYISQSNGTIYATSISSADAGVFYRQTSTAGDVTLATYSDVGGTRQLKFYVQANGTTANASDATLKKNIEPARGYLADIQNVEVVKYNWVTDEDGTPKELGVIAQQLEAVFPGMVATGGDGNRLVKYSVFVPMLIKSIQELKALVDTQASTITALQADVAALKVQP